MNNLEYSLLKDSVMNYNIVIKYFIIGKPQVLENQIGQNRYFDERRNNKVFQKFKMLDSI